MTLEWLEGVDDDDNTTWAAQSCPHDGGVHLVYMLTQVLRKNSVWWSIAESETELIDGMYDDEFQSLATAKQVCEALEQQVVEDEKNGCFE